MDLRLTARSRASLTLAAVALIAAALSAPPARAELAPPLVKEQRAIAIAKRDPSAVAALDDNPDLHISADRDEGTGDWDVGFFDAGGEVLQVVVGDVSGQVQESWTGYQVAWKMARGYEGAFGRKLNAPYVWLPLCAIFILGLLDWRRLRRVAHVDLLVIVGGFGISHLFFNQGIIGLSVPLAYPALLYLMGRMLWVAFRGGAGLRPSAPAIWLAVAALFLTGFKVGLDVADSNVIDVGYAGVIGADRISDGETLYGNFPDDNFSGDTYGPVSYYAYVPFEQIFPWSGSWDDLPAAHAASVFFDLATLTGLFLLGRRLRPGQRGIALGSSLAFAWAACPYSAYALESNTNDSLVAALLVATLLVLTTPALRGMMLALATAVKFVSLPLFPLFATYRGPGSHVETGSSSPQELGSMGDERGPVVERLRTAWSAITGDWGRTVGIFTAAFVATLLVVTVQFLIDPGLSTFLDRTLGHQLGRDSPFSVWGQRPSLEWLQTTIKVAVAALAVFVAFRPRRRDAAVVAALGAAIVIGVELIADHWFYLYIPWFLPFLFVALLARPEQPAAAA